MTTRDEAFQHVETFQEAIVEQLQTLWKLGHLWALTGGSSGDDGSKLLVTFVLEVGYSDQKGADAAAATEGAM